MYAIPSIQTTVRRSDRKNPSLQVLAPARPEPRVRDFGIGYGNSSGYASNRRYASNWNASRFQFG